MNEPIFIMVIIPIMQNHGSASPLAEQGHYKSNYPCTVSYLEDTPLQPG